MSCQIPECVWLRADLGRQIEMMNVFLGVSRGASSNRTQLTGQYEQANRYAIQNSAGELVGL